jgi:hypothetical protein
MTEFIEIQIKVCEDTIRRMEQAQKQKCQADFDLEKIKLLEILAMLKIADFSTYSQYSKYGEMAFS